MTLSSPAPPLGRVVELSAAQGQITLPAKVKVPGGALSASFTIHTSPILATARVRIYASIGGCGVRTVLTVVAP